MLLEKIGGPMAGVILIVSLIVVLLICLAVSVAAGNLVTKPPWNTAVKLVVFGVLISAPFVDEALGKHQFESLCRANGVEGADLSKAKGRRVKVEYSGRVTAEGTVLPTQQSDVTYRDADTGEVLIHHKDYYSKGGWLMRYTWIGMGSDNPMLFSGNGCGLVLRDRRFADKQILVIS
jgi:hypothetical protein